MTCPVTVTFILPEKDPRWHHGAWLARWREGMGEITAEEADRLVAEAHIRRALARVDERHRKQGSSQP